MAKLVWNDVGERFLETGLSHGVLYLRNEDEYTPNRGVAWDGLTSVDEDLSGDSSSPIYIDGVKFFQAQLQSDFSATLKAITYPPEFERFEGNPEINLGVQIDSQPAEVFDLSYQTKIGNDVDGEDHAYRLHLIYNITASPDMKSYQTDTNVASITEMSWKLDAVPEMLDGHRPTAHIILDSRSLPTTVLSEILDILYGTSFTDPSMISLEDLNDMIVPYVPLKLVLVAPDTYVIYEVDPKDSRSLMQDTVPDSPPIGAEPILWIDTSPDGYATAYIVEGA